MVVRLPALFCDLLTSATWTEFCIPQVSVGGSKRLGTSALTLNTKLLGCDPCMLPLAPVSLLDDSCHGGLSLDSNAASSIADSLRDKAFYLDLDDDTQREEYTSLEQNILIMDAMAAQTSTLAFLKQVKQMQHRVAHDITSPRSTPYRVAFLVHILVLADLLRSSKELQQTIHLCCQVVLPPVLRPAFQKLLMESGQITPSPSTISRWRMLLDGAFMMTQRRLNERSLNDVRYIMCDSSMQHNRDFEHIVFRSVKRSNLSRAFELARELCEFWTHCMKINKKQTPDKAGEQATTK